MRVSSPSGDVEGEGFPRLLPPAPWPPYLLPSIPNQKEGARGGAPKAAAPAWAPGFRKGKKKKKKKKIAALKTRRAAQCGATARQRARRAELLAGRARPLVTGCLGRAPARVRAECASSRSAVLWCPLSRAARGGRDRSRGVPGQADGRPAAPAAASRRRVFFGKLRLFLPLSGLRPKGADESPRRARSTLREALGGPSTGSLGRRQKGTQLS